MSTHRHIDLICVAVTILTLIITVLFINGEKLGIQVVSNEHNSSAVFTDNDLDSHWDTDGATKITLEGDKVTIDGTGAYFSDGNLTIAFAGKYILSGTLDNGSVVIDADGDDKIWLLLDGARLNCDHAPALYVKQADKVFLTLAENSENSIVSGKDATDEQLDGAIYAKDDLTVNGDGKLTVQNDGGHGIVCNDTLVMTGGEVTVNAAQDGLHAHDAVKIANVALTLSVGDDAIHANNDEENSQCVIESGTITVSKCYEGIEAVTVTIDGGTINITAEDDGINACGSGELSAINITGGEITILNANGRDADGLDSNHDIHISGGKLFISVVGTGTNNAIDYGSETGGVFEISGGTVIACGSNSMTESPASSSTQGFIIQNVNGSAGTAVKLSDADGQVLVSETVPYAFASLLVSAPGMKNGDAVNLTVGSSSEQVTVDNAASAGSGNPQGGMPGARDDRGKPENGQPGEQMPADGNNQPPAMPKEGDQPMNGADGTPPAMPEEGGQPMTDPGGTSPEKPEGQQPMEQSEGVVPPENGAFSEMPDRQENNRQPMQDQQEMTDDQQASSEERLVKLVVMVISTLVLLLGLFISGRFKDRV